MIAVGTVSLACFIFAIAATTPYSTHGSNLLNSSNPEIEQAFIQFIAKYGKSYASKDELPLRYEQF